MACICTMVSWTPPFGSGFVSRCTDPFALILDGPTANLTRGIKADPFNSLSRERPLALILLFLLFPTLFALFAHIHTDLSEVFAASALRGPIALHEFLKCHFRLALFVPLFALFGTSPTQFFRQVLVAVMP